jgi:SAM-dependent methyltransferase
MTGPDDPAAWVARTTAILDVARDAGRMGPPPRARPFFAIDRRTPTPLELVDELASRGIFRKYEHVLDFGGGLGASTRYMATRLGCTATATAWTPGEALAARTLTARAALDWQVFHVVADATRLPFTEAAFTHVWIVEALPMLGPSLLVLSEAHRVLRPGGHLGVQELVRRRDDEGLAGRGFVPAGQRAGELAQAGFVEIIRRDVHPARYVEPTQGRVAWAHLARRLGPADAFVADREALERALASGALGIIQLTARRP